MKYKKFVKRNCVDICIFIIVLVFIICVNLLITPPKQKNLGVGYAILRGDDNMINALGKIYGKEYVDDLLIRVSNEIELAKKRSNHKMQLDFTSSQREYLEKCIDVYYNYTLSNEEKNELLNLLKFYYTSEIYTKTLDKDLRTEIGKILEQEKINSSIY